MLINKNVDFSDLPSEQALKDFINKIKECTKDFPPLSKFTCNLELLIICLRTGQNEINLCDIIKDYLKEQGRKVNDIDYFGFRFFCSYLDGLDKWMANKKINQKLITEEKVTEIKKDISNLPDIENNAWMALIWCFLLKKANGNKKIPFGQACDFLFGSKNLEEIKKLIDIYEYQIENRFHKRFFKYVESPSEENLDEKEKCIEMFDKYLSLSCEILQPSPILKVDPNIKNFLRAPKLDDLYIPDDNKQDIWSKELFLDIDTKNNISAKIKRYKMVFLTLYPNSKNGRTYELFASGAFLLFLVVPMFFLKLISDYTSFLIKFVFNVFYSISAAFSEDNRLWGIFDVCPWLRYIFAFLYPLREIFYGACFLVASPFIFLYENFMTIKFLFKICGTGKKFLSFNKWTLFTKDRLGDVVDVKDLLSGVSRDFFDVEEIGFRFVLKYILGFAGVIRSEKIKINASVELDDKDQILEKTWQIKIDNDSVEKFLPKNETTNETSPLCYY